MRVYGADKVWQQLCRERFPVKRRTVEAADAPRRPARGDPLQARAHHAARYQGAVSAGPQRRIVGWGLSSSMETEFVLNKRCTRAKGNATAS